MDLLKWNNFCFIERESPAHMNLNASVQIYECAIHFVRAFFSLLWKVIIVVSTNTENFGIMLRYLLLHVNDCVDVQMGDFIHTTVAIQTF
jgi:hypothetical protein